ncbi:MAG: Spy/CpxP family protein refolding chaperone [Hyphomicrobiaceae bacterium]
MPISKKAIFAALTVSALAVTSVAMAQGGPGMMGYGGGPGRGWFMWDGWGPRWGGPDAMIDRVDGRLAFLKAELKITDAQSAAWNKLADAIRTSVRNRTERMRGRWSGDDSGKTLIERLEAREQYMTAHLEELKQIKAAWSELYQSLSDSQKKEADEIVLPMMGLGGPGMGMRFR